METDTGRQATVYVKPFIENRAAIIDPAWNTAGFEYEEEIQLWVASESLETSADRFKKVITEYTKSTTNIQLKNFDILETHTWEEVQVVAAEAVAKYKSKEQGFSGFFRKAGRGFGKVSPDQGWVQTLPCGDYTSVVCGALKLVFGAAAGMQGVRKKVLEALDCLPDTEISEQYLREYQNNKALARAAEELYVAILDAIVGMLQWLDASAYKKALKALVSQGNYGSEVNSKLEAVKEKSGNFKKVVDASLHNRVGEIRRGQWVIERNQLELGRAQNCIGLAVLDQLKAQQNALNTIHTFLEDIFGDGVKYSEWCKDFPRIGGPARISGAIIQPAANLPVVSLEQLLRDLQDDLDIVKRDVEDTMTHGNLLDLSSQQRAAYLAKNPRFQSWLRSGSSDTLIVDGIGDVVLVSAMSFFSAMLSRELSKISNVITLSFFCGSASTRASTSKQTKALMRSLNSQLLANPLLWPSLDLNLLSQSISNLKDSSLEDLYKLFSQLVKTIESGNVLFVLIDGISWVEKSNFGRKEILVTMQRLRDLADECSPDTGVIFKLLVTSPKTSLYVKHKFAKHKQLTLPTDVGDNGIAFTQMHMQQQRLLGSKSKDGGSGVEECSWMAPP